MRPAGVLLGACGWAILPAGLRACESCSNALAQDPGALGFSKGIYYSIIFIFVVLGALVAAIVRAIVKESRKAPTAPGDGPR